MTRQLQESVFISRGEAGIMPTWASKMLALPFRKRSLHYFWDPHLLFTGERDHSGRSGWHVASRLFRRPNTSAET